MMGDKGMPDVLCEGFDCKFNQDGACTHDGIVKLILPDDGSAMPKRLICWSYQKSEEGES